MVTDHDQKADVDEESTARRRMPGQGGQPEVCEPCTVRLGLSREVLTLAEAEERVRAEAGRLRAYRCVCEQPDVWHTTPRYGAARVFSDSGP